MEAWDTVSAYLGPAPPCGARFRDIFFSWTWLLVWLVTVFLQVVPGRLDLITYYGWYPAVGATVAVGASLWLFRGERVRWACYLGALYGAVTTLGWLWQVAAADFPVVLASLWNDVAWVGPGAYGVLIDTAGCAVVAFTHVCVEYYRRDSLPRDMTMHLVMAGCLVAPMIVYPVFLVLYMPSARNSYESDLDGVTRKLGPWPMVVYGVEAVAIWCIWSVPIIEQYRTCGPRWRPQDFNNCGLNTTFTSKFTVNIILVFVFVLVFTTARRLGVNTAAHGQTANMLLRVWMVWWWAVLMFFNVACAFAVLLAINYVDMGDNDTTIPGTSFDTPSTSQARGRSTSKSASASTTAARRRSKSASRR